MNTKEALRLLDARRKRARRSRAGRTWVQQVVRLDALLKRKRPARRPHAGTGAQRLVRLQRKLRGGRSG